MTNFRTESGANFYFIKLCFFFKELDPEPNSQFYLYMELEPWNIIILK
jgi:hypothetical protein